MQFKSCGLCALPSCTFSPVKSVGILAHVERADEDGASGLKPFDQRLEAAGAIFVGALDIGEYPTFWRQTCMTATRTTA